MKWVSHKVLTAATALAVSSSVIPSVLAVVGSTLPDAVEGVGGSWERRHRRTSHWVLPYAAAAWLLYREATARGVDGILVDNIVSMSLHPTGLGALALFWVVFGCLCHLAQDAVSGKIPFLDPRRRRGVVLVRTGSFLEYVVITGALTGVLVWKLMLSAPGTVTF